MPPSWGTSVGAMLEMRLIAGSFTFTNMRSVVLVPSSTWRCPWRSGDVGKIRYLVSQCSLCSVCRAEMASKESLGRVRHFDLISQQVSVISSLWLSFLLRYKGFLKYVQVHIQVLDFVESATDQLEAYRSHSRRIIGFSISFSTSLL